MKTSGLSGNEIFCLSKKHLTPGSIVVGNSVHSLGLLRSFTTGVKAVIGGELTQITQLISEGRESAYKRMLKEAVSFEATGITGVTSELVLHQANVEFLSVGSAVHSKESQVGNFSTANSGQQLYALLDAGYKPTSFCFGNTAYSIGLGGNILGSLKKLARGEIREFSDIFNTTRHLSLKRIEQQAKACKSNAVLGIKTTILPMGNFQEMVMIGTGAKNPALTSISDNGIITSNLSSVEVWNLANTGYAPVRLLLGTSIYSLGLVGGFTASLKSFVKGEISELTNLIYEARENALDHLSREATEIGCDDVIGVKTYIYDLGGGLIEVMAIGTGVKKHSSLKLRTDSLPAEVIAVEEQTYIDLSRPASTQASTQANLNTASIPRDRNITPTAGRNNNSTMLSMIVGFIFFAFVIIGHFFLNH